ncbi:MAG: Ig-like domain-containing protein [Betaproteobacteria bacterium]
MGNFLRNHRIFALVLSLLIATGAMSPSATAQSVAAGQTLFTATANCTTSGCHLNGAEVNGANASAVINNANTLGMGGLGPGGATLTAQQITDITAYLATTVVDPYVAPANATYNTALDIVIPTNATLVAASRVVAFGTTYSAFNRFVTSDGAKGTATYLAATSTIRYTPSINQCGADTFTYVARNTGAPTISSSSRSVSVFINSPTPTSSLPTQNIAYSTSATTLAGLVTGGNASGLTVTAQPAVGTVTVGAGPSLTYTASSTSYAASVSFKYVATGPCSTQSSPVNVTINLTTLPPAPTVAVPGTTTQTPLNTAVAIDLTSSISGISSSISVISATNGTTSVSGNSVTFTPTAGFSGTGSFTYQATGPGGTSATSSAVNVTVLPAVPTVTAPTGPFSTAFNTPINIDLTGRVAGSYTSIATTAVTNGSTSVAGNVVTFTPTSSFTGTASFQFTATGLGGTSAPSSAINITVLPAAPVVAARSVLVSFQLPLPIDLTAQITGVSTSIAVVTAPTNGMTSVSGNIVTYTPNALFTGADSFAYQATGPGGTSAPAVVSISVIAAAPPTATAPSPVTTAFNTQVAIDLTAQLGGVFTSLVVVAAPTNGTIVSVVGNIVTYRPTNGFSGADSFTYRALGPGGTQSTPPALVNITVTPAVPIVTAPSTVSTGFNTPVSINLSAQITGLATSIAIATPVAHGATSISGTTVTYTPTSGYFGADSFTYTATGPGGTSLPSPAVNISVASPPPTAASQAVSVAFAGNGRIDLAPQLTGTVTSINIVTAPTNGSIISVAGTTVTYLPNSGFSGTDSFTYRAIGPGGTSGIATVSITVTNAPQPTAGNRAVNVAFNTGISIDLTAQISGFVNSIAVVTPPTNGIIVLVAGNVITYTPKIGFIGNDSFTYAATGPGGTTAPATVAITVAAPPPPSVTDTTLAVAFGSAASINLGAKVTGAFNSISITTVPEHGATSVTGSIVTYTPAKGYFGEDSFSFVAIGPGGTSTPATVVVTVGTLVPVANAFKMIVPLNTSTTIDLAPFITGSAVSGIVVSTAPKHGSATVSGTKLTFTPTHDYFGTDAFNYAAFGNAGTSPIAIVTVTIVGRPDPTKDATVTGLVAAQSDSAQRFSKAQISNFQSRMESLHRAGTVAASSTAGKAPDEERAALALRSPTRDTSAPRTESKVVAKENAYLNASYAAAPAAAETAGGPQKAIPLLSDAVSLASTGTINIASVASAVTGAASAPTADAPSVWMAGTANFGTRGANGSRNSLDFSTAGVSMGVDRRFGDQLVLGAGLGFARDRTAIGSDGSNSRARAYSGIAYGSFQPSATTFIDGLIGIGWLDFKSQRYVAPIDDVARGNRNGRQVFGSIAGGYEYRDNGILVSPYAKLDYASNRLDQNTESGAGQYALTYYRQTTPSVQGVLGLRAESVHTTNFGLAAPRIRAEYRHEFQGTRQTTIGYADNTGGLFGINTGAVARNSLLLAVGSDFVYRGGWTLGVDYQIERSSAFAKDSSQGIKFTITKDLDGKDSPYSLIAAAITPAKPVDIQVDAGFMFDTNVTRAKLASLKLSDRIYSVNAGKSKIFGLGENFRATVTGSFGGEKFDNFYRLSRAMAGVQAEIAYRASADFDAPTFALFAQSTAEHYQSSIRNGYRYSAGFSVRQPLTDKISLFGAILHDERVAKSAVFTNRFNAARFNADYSLSALETVYLTGEYRKGHIVSTGLPSLEILDVADVFVPDDAYLSGQFFSYRFEGKTVISTLGYNLGLGPRHSLDLSWRRAVSTPSFRPSYATSPTSYVADQYSIVYLIRF